jgi:hypothetical protein
MLSVKIDGSETRVLTNPKTGSMLNVITADGMVYSCWKFSKEELELVSSGLPVWVVMHGELIPEFYLTVGSRESVVPAGTIARARKLIAGVVSPAGVKLVRSERAKDMIIELLALLFAVSILTCLALAAWTVTRLLLGK